MRQATGSRYHRRDDGWLILKLPQMSRHSESGGKDRWRYQGGGVDLGIEAPGDRVEKPPAYRPVGKLKHTLPRASSLGRTVCEPHKNIIAACEETDELQYKKTPSRRAKK